MKSWHKKKRRATALERFKKEQKVILNQLASLVQHPITPTQDIINDTEFSLLTETRQQQVLDHAIQFNNDVLLAKKQLEVSRRALKESGSNFMPTVSAFWSLST
ncbi:TolC family protein (plasmid) [Vibrio sp. SS-MA-C1-2]|uniref:TolC family protein n=1 Tax=Vibrio sp. SS-MA-C1-2 TaxID=2908646 RepID=UPI001F476652|nr:TolC family protein [Vibrio sp. SS-MA-C1-2]UJF20312.1 TolC family protein [Vibrio sp. SS-MA-C1-2]